MVNGSKSVKYIGIADELRSEIISGNLRAGEKFYSRSRLAARYGISEPTAVRIQNLLASYGLLRKVPGGGSFVNFTSTALAKSLAEQAPANVSRIVEYRFAPGMKYAFPMRFYNALDELLKENPFPYSINIYTPSEVSLDMLNLNDVEPDTGYLVFFQGALSMFYCGKILLSPMVHSVLVDNVVPGSDCVITDSFDGMGKIVDYLFSKGASRFIFVKYLSKSLGDFYRNERACSAVYHCRRRGKECLVPEINSLNGILELIRSSDEKTAVMFPQDTEAVRMRSMLSDDECKRVLVTGFDDYVEFEEKPSMLTTVAVDHRTIIEKALEILKGPCLPEKQIVRVPGKLVVREA